MAELSETLEVLNAEDYELEARISQNIQALLQDNNHQTDTSISYIKAKV